MTISACLIVKNEAHTLFPCIASIYQQVDEIILLDTGSTDGTLNLDWLYDHEHELMAGGPITWPATVLAEHAWQDSFAEARNQAMSLAQGDWILCIDADDRMQGDIRTLADNAKPEDMAFVFDIQSVFTDEWTSVSPQIRLFRNRQGFEFRGRVHEQLQTADGQDVPRTPSDVTYQHIGYDQRGITVLGKGARTLEGKKARNKRLLDMGLTEEPENPRYWYERMREHLREEEHAEAFAAGQKCLGFWQAAGQEPRDYVAPLLEYLLDCGRRTGMRTLALAVWDQIPAAYRTLRAWSLFGVIQTAVLG